MTKKKLKMISLKSVLSLHIPENRDDVQRVPHFEPPNEIPGYGPVT